MANGTKNRFLRKFALKLKYTFAQRFYFSEIVEEVVESRKVSQRDANPTLFSHTPSSSRRLTNLNHGRSLSSSHSSNQFQNPVSLMHSSLDSVFAKMSSATQSLMDTDDIETSTQLVKLIKECADCALALKNAAQAHQ